jgi:ppGpp synthetase/RelA/SpoT-type nucleotidyltranferase
MRPIYKNLANKVESIIREVLNNSGVSYYTITSRAKEIESFSKKAKKEKYKNPQEEIKDFAGIRIITFVKSEVNQCCDVIKPLFDIDQKHSVDKTKELGSDKVGYRSIHYVAKLTDDRLILPEYKVFKDFCFEIQIRTILEHAWADISHDRNYKFDGVLPPDIV